jgi:phosphohistidine phosphatase
MDLLLLRHGKAAPSSEGSDDAARPLTGDGKRGIRTTARWMKSRKMSFDLIATSPLARAGETAEIIARSLDIRDRLTVWEELAPGGDLDTVLYHASQFRNDAGVLLVGHEPALSMMIGRIIGGGKNASITLAKGGLAKIQNYSFDKQPSGDLQWLLTQRQIADMR